MTSRRQFLGTAASATVAVTVSGAALAVEAAAIMPAAEPDPFLAFMAECKAADDRFDSIAGPLSDEDADAAFDTILRPFINRQNAGDMPAATTAAGAAEALRDVLRHGGIDCNPSDRPMVLIALAYLEGRDGA